MTGIIVEEFKAVRSNSLRGFARVRMPSGMILHDVALHQRGDERWASPPGKPVVGRDGTQIVKAGKAVYSPVISFASKELRDTFSSAIVAAVEAAHPEAFE